MSLIILPFTFTNDFTVKIPQHKIEISNSNGSEIVVDRYWDKNKIEFLINNSKHPSIIRKLVVCESQFTNIKRIDSNNFYSYGILQYQKQTWDEWSKKSGIKGNPMNPDEAVIMADWALDNGLLSNWSCAKIMKLK